MVGSEGARGAVLVLRGDGLEASEPGEKGQGPEEMGMASEVLGLGSGRLLQPQEGRHPGRLWVGCWSWPVNASPVQWRQPLSPQGVAASLSFRPPAMLLVT